MALKIGDTIPDFMAKDSYGNDFDSRSIIGKKTVVIYFYPKDNTPGCTAQACNFRDQYQDFKDLGAEVIGVSSDDADSHQRFARQYNLPFILLSDSDKKIKKLFNVTNSMFGLLPARVTFVVDKKGVLRMVFDSLMSTKHMSKALDTVKKIVYENEF